MAEIINLRRQRKARVRAEAAEKAADNRVRHGRSKQERRRLEVEAERERRRLDGLRLGSDRTADDQTRE